MAQTNRVTLKTWFETGKTPTQAQFGSLIDSFLNFSDDTITPSDGTVTAAKLDATLSNRIVANDAKVSYDDQAAVALNTAKISFNVTASTKVGFLSVTQPVDLDAIESAVAVNTAKVSYTDQAAVSANTAKISFDTTASTKVGHLTVTGAIDLDQMDIDVAANTAKISFDNGASTKLGYITVTGAVNLDTMSSAISANTAKVTNATHTGDVTGSTVLSIASGAVDISHLSATGTPSSSTYLRGDNTWASLPTGTSHDAITLNGSGTYVSLGANQVLTVDPITVSDITDFASEVASNAAVALNTAKISFDNVASTKVGYLTVSQAIDLDTMLSDTATNNAKIGITAQQASDITTNNAKTGITAQQTADIITNNAKTGITAQQTSDITTNNAKVTNATHTGDVTGDTVLTISAGAVDIAMLSASGTPGATTYLRGDNTWTQVSYNEILAVPLFITASSSDTLTNKTIVATANTITNISTSNFDTNTKDAFKLIQGSLLDSPSIVVSSNGTVITLSIEKSGGGDLRANFSTGVYIWDTTPADTVVLAEGSDVSPSLYYVYFLESTKTLTASIGSWPSAEHAPVATVLVQSAIGVQNDGAYKVHAWTDHLANGDNMGHLYDLNYWIRQQRATWQQGVSLIPTAGAGQLDIATSAGVVLQLHPHTFPAFDTGAASQLFVVNDPDAAYTKVNSLTIADGVDKDANGVALGNSGTDHYNLVIWGVVNETTGDCKLMVNLPSEAYPSNQGSRATLDLDATSIYTIPTEYTGVGFLIARLTIQENGETYTILQQEDLRGLYPSLAPSGGVIGGGNEFVDNIFRINNTVDITKQVAFDVSGVDTATARTLTIPNASGVISLTGHTHVVSNITDFASGVSSNAAVAANTAKISFDSTSSTKVGHISVTQAVDLDTMESNIATNNAKVGVTTELKPTDINTLAKINAIITDATLIDTGDARLSNARTPTAHTHPASEVTDFDTEVGNNSAVVLNTAKIGITTGQANAIIANTAKVTFDSTASTKVGYISVTQAVDLDTMESNIATNNDKVTNATHTGDVTGSTVLTIATDAVDIAMLSATGSPSATTFLRGDNTWAAPTDTGAVSKTATGDQAIASNLSIAGQVKGGTNTKTFAASATFDCDDGNTQKMVMTGNVTTLAISNEVSGSTYRIVLEQGGTGSYTIPTPAASFGTKTDNAVDSGDFPTTVGSKIIFDITVESDGDTFYSVETITI